MNQNLKVLAMIITAVITHLVHVSQHLKNGRNVDVVYASADEAADF